MEDLQDLIEGDRCVEAAGDVRCQIDMFHIPERMISRQRFGIRDIQAYAREVSVFDDPQEERTKQFLQVFER